MSTLTLTPKLQITNPPAAPIVRRRSLIGVMWNRFLKWLEESTSSALVKTARRLGVAIIIGLLYFAPQFTMGYITAVMQWNGYRIPMFIGTLAVVMNMKPLWNWMKRKRLKPRKGNQHTFHGIPIPELVSLLMDTGSFRKEDAQKRLAMTHGQWFKIADELEKRGVLVRGESNARVLQKITREELAKQLNENFPLQWDQERQAWFERDGAMQRWALDQEWKQRQVKEDTERKERKLERVKGRLASATAFQRVLAMSGVGDA